MSVVALSSQSSSSPPCTPNTRPPSRSERLLRDTLRRDELALATPPVPTRIRHSRRSSTPTKAADYDRNYDADKIAPFLHRSGSATTVQRPQHRPPALAHGADVDAALRYSRPGSPSPTSRRDTQDSSHPPPLTLTPHGQVLRTRLERVLQAGRGIARAESREPDRSRGHGRDRRKSPPSLSSGHSDDCGDDAWLQDSSMPNNISSSPTSLNSHHPNDKDYNSTRSQTDPLPLTPPSPSPSRSRSRSHSYSAHGPSHSHASHHREQHCDQPEEPLTPPPTPPPSTPFLTPSRPRLTHSAAHPSTAPQTPFNARTASVQCRQIEGYVSFAAVEGLGEPPDADDEVLDVNAPDEGKGRILGRIWRALGVEMAGR